MKIYSLLLLTLLTFLTLLSFSNSTSSIPISSFTDHPCEVKTNIILAYIFAKQPLPDEYKDLYKFFFYSGSGLNELGDYDSCLKLGYSNYYIFNISLAASPMAGMRIGICYFKECDITYLNESKSDLLALVKHYTGYDIDPNFVSFSEPDDNIRQQRTDHLIGAIIVTSILVLIILLNITKCVVKYIVVVRPKKVEGPQSDESLIVKKSIGSSRSGVNPKKSFITKVLDYFDFIQNAKKVTEVKKSTPIINALHVFDGVRVLSTCWVVHGHSFLFSPMKNFMSILLYSREWYFCIIVSGFYAVDVFFYLSGFMFCYSLQKYMNKDIPRFKIFFLAVLNRYLRLLPLLLFIVLGLTYLLPFLGSGPVGDYVAALNISCEKYWWHNILYINNLVKYDPPGMCAGHTWYLANDMQFFLASIILFIFLNNQKAIRNTIISFIFIASLGYQVYQALKYGYRFNDIAHMSASDADFFDNYYIQPWARCTPYIVGFYFCELFLETPVYKRLPSSGNTQISFLRKVNNLLIRNNVVCFFLFLFSLALINFSIFIAHLTNTEDLPMIYHALMLAFNKTLFVIGLGFIIHLTFLGKFGLIKSFLSLKFFTVVSRLTYGIYLIHLYFMGVIYFSTTGTYYLSFVEFIYLTVGFVSLSFVTSFVLSLLLESPVVMLSKKLSGGSKAE
jgi:peptidoglycan/LPS O-acetylase OafA/YrhL